MARARTNDLILLSDNTTGFFEVDLKDGEVELRESDLSNQTVRVLAARDNLRCSWPTAWVPRTGLMRVRSEGQEYLVPREASSVCLVAGN